MGRLRNQKENDPPFTTSSCDVCEALDTVEMVQCDTCNQFTHFSCAGVDASVAERRWLCRTCLAKQNSPKIQADATTKTSSDVATSKSSVHPTTHAQSSSTQPKPVKPSTPLTEDQKKIQSLRSQISKMTRENTQDLEREKSKTSRADDNAREAMSVAEGLRNDLIQYKKQTVLAEDLQKQIAQLQEQVNKQEVLLEDLRNAKQEADASRLLIEDLRAQIKDLSAAQVLQPISQDVVNEEVQPVPQKNPRSRSYEERLDDLRRSIDLGVVSSPNHQEIPDTIRSTSVQPSTEAITQSVIRRLSSVVTEIVRELVPTTISSQGSASSSISRSPQLNGTANQLPADDQIRKSRVENHRDQFEEKNQQESSVDKLAVTMRRRYLTKLPKFDGESLKKWPYFESVYETTTAQGQFSEIDNVNRLREALKGKAEKAVKSHLMFPISATEIMNELREAFGKPDQILRELTVDLLKVQPIKSQVDPNLRNLSTELRNYVASLMRMKMTSALFNTFVLVQLEEKLHHGHRREWIAFKTIEESIGVEISIRTFADFVKARVKELPSQVSTHVEQAAPVEPQRKVRRLNAHYQSTNDSGAAPIPRGCFKCKGDHVLVNCPDFKRLMPKERSKFAYDNRICSSCLKSTKHLNKDCHGRRPCNVDGCQMPHHPLLHYARSSNGQMSFYRQPGGSNPATSQASTTSNVNTDHRTLSVNTPAFTPSGSGTSAIHHQAHVGVGECENSVLFKILPVRIQNDQSYIDTYAFLDDGSSLTLVDKTIYDKLALQGEHEQLHLQWTKGITRTEDAYRTSVTISGHKGQGQHVLTNVYAVEHLDLPVQTVDAKHLKARYAHLRGIPIPDFQNGKPQILIGLQHSKFLLGTNNHTAGEDDPIASKTQLGWTVFGNAAHSLGVVALTNHKRTGVQLSIREATKGDDELHQLVKQYFTTENFGVSPTKRDLISAENERALAIMNRTMRKVDDRYEIGLLWKTDNIHLPDSYPMAMNRLINLERSLKKRPELLEWKNKHVEELLQKGYARKATEEELNKPWSRVWYSPTFVVVNPNKLPPKPRDVADVAAKVQGQSLNSNLLKGPDNMAPLLQGLFRFRENAIAVNADVKEMFHQIGITEEDQQCQRFLYRNCDDTQPPTVYVMQRMMFGPTRSPSCAQFVKNKHAALYEKDKPEASAALINFTYVDDYFNSHPTIEEALRVTKDAFTICDSMGFDLLGVQSNKLELLESLPPQKVKSSLVSIEPQDSENYVAKVLGMYWQSFPDFFTFKMTRDELMKKMMTTDFVPSKREILRTLLRSFDPLGIIAHYLVRGKIVLQEIWREGTDWDEPIPICLIAPWQEFIHELPNIENVRTALQRIKRNCQLSKLLKAKPLMPLMGRIAVLDVGVFNP